MSNFLAIATVTASLQSLLQDALNVDVPGATVTVVRPDGSDNGLPGVGVNIYLYQVTPNNAWRNTDLVTRSSDGRLVNRPRVALDLHYLLTFYGADEQFEPQRVLGSVARTLHTQPVLAREVIQDAVAATPVLVNSDLAQEVELVKFMPLSLSLEELSKLWSVFFQTPYTLSMAYLATTVLIEAELAPQRALPVQVRNLSVVLFQQAFIDKVVALTGETDPVVFGDTVAIQGERLSGPVQAVRVGTVDLAPASVSSREIRVALADPDLRAGIQGVQVIYDHGGRSNVAPLVLRPRIVQDGGGAYQITVTDVTVEPDGARSATITVQLAPQVGPQQQVTLYLNERPPTSQPVQAYSFPAEARSSDTDTVRFRVRGVEAGNYLVRVDVAGAESLLEQDGAGNYSAPAITIP